MKFSPKPSFFLSLYLFLTLTVSFLLPSSFAKAEGLEDFILQDFQENYEEAFKDIDDDFYVTTQKGEEKPFESLDKKELTDYYLQDIGKDTIPKMDLSALEINELLPNYYYNILILGLDTRTPGEFVSSLSDVIMICSIHKKTGEIKLTSIARDTAVTIPGMNNPHRINTAYKFGWLHDEENGGPRLAMATVNYNFQMNIERFVTVNFYGLMDIVDSLGGIEVPLTKEEAKRINYEMSVASLDGVKREKLPEKDGIYLLSGAHALRYVRMRKLDSDFGRTARQRKFMDLLIKKVLSDITVDNLSKVITALLPHVYTNIPTIDMITLALSVLNSDQLAHSRATGWEIITDFRIPMNKTYTYANYNGASVLAMEGNSLQKNIQSLHEFIYGQHYYEN